MSATQVIGTIAAAGGWILGTGGIGNEVETIGAFVVLIAGIATAWYGSKAKVNLATMRGNVETAETATDTWKKLAEGREETIKDLLADKESMRRRVDRADTDLVAAREKIAALEALPRFEDVTQLVERHHGENLKNFRRIEDLVGALVVKAA